MLKKYILIVVLYYFPVAYLPLLFAGLQIHNNFFLQFLIAAILGLCIIIVNPIIGFLTIKGNVLTKFLFRLVFIIAAVYAMDSSIPLLHIIPGGISHQLLDALNLTKEIPSFMMNKLATLALISLLLAFWGIIVDILIN